MTILTMVWALKTAPVPQNDPVAHLVLIAYADHANDDGTAAWPSVATVARYARCTPRTVHTKLRVLLEHGLMRPGDQRLVDHLPANRRPVVYDLVMNPFGGEPQPVQPDPERESAVQPGVKFLHPKDQRATSDAAASALAGVSSASPQSSDPVDDPRSGVNQASPQPVDNPVSGVKQPSPQEGARGEAGRTSGVNASSYKPPLEPPTKNQGFPQAGTSPAVIHRLDEKPRPDRCPAHRHLDIPVACLECRLNRHASDGGFCAPARSRPRSDGLPAGGLCEHDGDGGVLPDGRPRCPACRRGLTGGTAPWDARPVASRLLAEAV